MANARILQKCRRSGWLGQRESRTRGNTLVLIVAVMAILIAILLFALGYTRLVGSNQEQKTAIEAASLAAAKEISRIVINDPNFGFISLSDAAPVGKATAAGDNYFMPVFGINTLMGTIRLDLIIAESMNNTTMKNLAKRDLVNLKQAKENLVTELKLALTGAGNSKDSDGNVVNPYTAAEQAYQQNQVRLTGGSSYVAGSMKLSLGCLNAPLQTNIPTPRPSSYSHVSGNQTQNNCYMSGINIPFGGEDFVFAAVTDSLKLVDTRKFVDSAAGLPYQMPSIVKAEADQKMQDPERKTIHVVHAVSCAAPASVYDPKPAPGSLTFSFPDGTPPEITSINSILVLSGLNGNTTILQKSTGGDYPEPGSNLSPLGGGPLGGGSLDGGGLLSTGIYDWLKRAGARLDAEKAVSMLSENFTNSGAPSIHIFSVKANGTIQYNTSVSIEQNPYWPASENQLYGQSQDALLSSDKFAYDMHVRDYSYQPGTINGGKHGGEPLVNPTVVVPIVTEDSREVGSTKLQIAMSGDEGSMSFGDCGGSGDGATSWVWIGSPPPGPPTKATISGVSYKIWPNASSPILGRNDFGLLDPSKTLIQMASGPGGGLMRPTYLQNGAAVDIRFRQVVDLAPIGIPKKFYVNKKGDLID